MRSWASSTSRCCSACSSPCCCASTSTPATPTTPTTQSSPEPVGGNAKDRSPALEAVAQTPLRRGSCCPGWLRPCRSTSLAGGGLVGQNFLSCDREQELLLPPSLREWLPDGHLAWFVIDAVAEMDLAAFYGAYREDGHGRAAHDPAMMVALLLYAYAVGRRSSR